jgi:hypothetical protein
MQVSAASAGIYAMSSLRFDSDGKRIPLREHFKRMREQQAQAQAMPQVCCQVACGEITPQSLQLPH